MRSPDSTDADRIEGLLRGMPPETEREAHIEGLIRELRADVPPAPLGLREHVRGLREPERRRTFGWKPVLVVVPLALALVGAAFLGGRGGGDEEESAAGDSGATMAPRARETIEQAPEAALVAPTVAPDVGRAQEWDVSLALAVRDNGRLSEASAEAIRTTRELGGFVVSSSVSTQGRVGEARLVVRIPQRRVQEAIALFSGLGTITGQNVSIQDRQAELDRLARRIDTLRVSIAQLNLRLRNPNLDEAERLRLQLRRERFQSELNQLTRRRTNVSNEVAMSAFSLVFETRRAAATAGESRFDDAVSDALGVLAVAAAVAVFLLIVLAPLAVVALVAYAARRSYRRKSEQRLLDRPQPG
jgi:Domain of unknown function (DUF4349)